MGYDLTEIKERIDLTALFTQDGHVIRRVGANTVTHCPFHEEKTPSCKVEALRFHCFGCGAGTDVFDYWERSRQVSRKDAIADLARLSGVSPDLPGFHKPITRPQPAPVVDDIIPPLTPDETAEWLEAVALLKASTLHIERIAKWRGYPVDLVQWAVERGIIGIFKWAGAWREAFLVEMPVAPSGPFIPVSVHVRLGPHTRGNDRPKQSWRFTPSKRGAWPLIFGDLHTATHVFTLEGQWDALALIGIMGWHRHWPDGTAVIGVRGASSFRKLLAHYAFHEKATAFAFADADNAGKEWFHPGGFIDQLRRKVARVHTYQPGAPGTDFNDLVKLGFDRPQLIHLLRSKLPSKRHRKPSGPTFLAWCKSAAKAKEGPHVHAASIVLADSSRPKGRQRFRVWERHWATALNLPEGTCTLLRAAWDTWMTECEAA